MLLSVQALRALLYGFGSVLLGTVLAAEGLSDTAVGGVFAAMLAGMALVSVAVGRWGDRAGRRRLYRGLLMLMGASGVVFAVTSWLPALLLAALTGTLSTDPNESGPITSLEQAMLGGVSPSARIRAFGRYNAIAYLAGAVGALLAGGPAALRSLFPALPADQRWLLAFPVVAAVCVAVSTRLHPEVEVPPSAIEPEHVARRSSAIRGLAALFAVDAFGGGMVVQSFLVFWFHRRFGASAPTMGVVLFGAGLLAAGSAVVAARLAARIGLLETMVFTHLPSNLLLTLIPVMPSLPWAIAILLSRFALSQMDVPARQAYVVAMVAPEERTAAAAYTNTARYVGRPGGPAVGGALMQHAAVGAPFVAAGALKIAYDLVLYRLFRRVPIERGDE